MANGKSAIEYGAVAKRTRAAQPDSQRTGFILGILAGIAVMGVVVFLIVRRDEPSAPPRQATAPPAAAPVQRQAQAPPPPQAFSETAVAAAERIEAAEARRLLESGAAVAIDVRDVQSYAAGHIPGALQIPLAYVQGEIPWFPRDRKLITYCT